MFRINFKTSFRNLWKNKLFTVLNIFGLALGITCAGLIFLWVEDEMTFDNVHRKKNSLYSVRVNMQYNGNVYTMGSTPRPMAAAIKNEIPGIANFARVSDEEQRLLVKTGNHSFYAAGRYADPTIFQMFTLDFTEGHPVNAFPQLYSLVITESTARKFFGTASNVTGKTVRVNNEQDYTITGVVKDLPPNSSFRFEWLAPFAIDLQRAQSSLDWDSYGPHTYVELEPGAHSEVINRQLKNFIQKKKADETNTAFLFPLSQWHLYNEFENGQPTGGGRIEQVRTFTIIAWIILLIACINFMNLATAGSQHRSKEVGIRKVLGAERKALILQFMGETLVMSGIAALLAVTFIALLLPAFNTLMQKQLALHPGNPFHVISLLLIAVICGLIAGSYPSLYVSSFHPVAILKGMKIKAGRAALIRKGLVVMQFTVSVVFIISTIVIYSQIQYAKERKLGFNKDNLIEIDMQRDIAGTFPVIKQALLQTGLVTHVAMADHATLRGGDTDKRFRWQGKSTDNEVSIAFRYVSPDYIATSGMQVIEGRDFSEDIVAERTNVVITRSMAKMMGNESAVGKIIQSPRGNKEGEYTNMQVVGVVQDFVYGNVYGKPGPVILLCPPVRDANLIYVRLQDRSQPNQMLAGIEAVMKKHNPDFPFQYRFVDEQFNNIFLNEMLISKISGLFAGLAILISCLGLFGLAAYTAGARIKEMGIRKVLGASVTELTRLLSKDFLQLVMIACLLAFPIAWWIMHDWLLQYEYRITIDGWIFIAAGITAVLIALITVSSQAIKAALTNPVKSLRAE